eukprot:scaffold8407_cov32-Phaeocystis_antarctica.AAC.1
MVTSNSTSAASPGAPRSRPCSPSGASSRIARVAGARSRGTLALASAPLAAPPTAPAAAPPIALLVEEEAAPVEAGPICCRRARRTAQSSATRPPSVIGAASCRERPPLQSAASRPTLWSRSTTLARNSAMPAHGAISTLRWQLCGLPRMRAWSLTAIMRSAAMLGSRQPLMTCASWMTEIVSIRSSEGSAPIAKNGT